MPTALGCQLALVTDTKPYILFWEIPERGGCVVGRCIFVYEYVMAISDSSLFLKVFFLYNRVVSSNGMSCSLDDRAF